MDLLETMTKVTKTTIIWTMLIIQDSPYSLLMDHVLKLYNVKFIVMKTKLPRHSEIQNKFLMYLNVDKKPRNQGILFYYQVRPFK